MARRRRSRQRRREGRRDRAGSGERAVAVAPPPVKEAKAAPGVSWTGLAGGLLGFVPLAAVGIKLLVDPPEAGRGLAAVPLAMSAVYLPAIWASVSGTPRRRAVLRGVVAASIAMVFVSLPFLGATLALVLVPATALLAVAGGLVWGR